MTESTSPTRYPDLSIQDVGERTRISGTARKSSYARCISPSFDGQDHSSAVKLLPSADDPDPILSAIAIRGGYLYIGQGYDGVSATADGVVIRETARFAFDFVNPAPEALASQARDLDGDFVTILDSVWPNHYHLLALAIPRLYFAKDHCPDAEIVVPAQRGPADAPPNMLERMIDRAGFSQAVRRLPDGLYRVRNLHLIWSNYRQPPFLHLFPETFSHFESFARQASSADTSHAPRRFFILRPHSPRLDDEAGLTALDACLDRHDFARVQLENLSLAEQIGLFRNATHVVGAHGAGLTNIVFSKPDLRVLEINMDLDGRGFTRPWFLLIAVQRRMHYQYLNVSEDQFTPDRIETAFERLMAPPPRPNEGLLPRGFALLRRIPRKLRRHLHRGSA